MKKNGERSKIISCSGRTRREFLERWNVRKPTKERCEKWKSLSSFGEVSERERERERERGGERERGKNPIYAIDERDTKTTE